MACCFETRLYWCPRRIHRSRLSRNRSSVRRPNSILSPPFGIAGTRGVVLHTSLCVLHSFKVPSDAPSHRPALSRTSRRTILQDQNRKLQCFDAVPAGHDGLLGPAPRGAGGARAATLPTGPRKGAAAIVDKLLSKARELHRAKNVGNKQ